MKKTLLVELAEAGIKILKNQLRLGRQECCVTAQDLANWIDAPELGWRLRGDELREIRDAIQSMMPNWVLHTMAQDGFDAVAAGVNLAEVECTPMGGRPSVGLRLVTRGHDVTYAAHCRHRDFVDDRRRDRHDKDTFRALEIGILTKEEAQMQFVARHASEKVLPINGMVNEALEEVISEHTKLCRLTSLKGVSWIEFMGHRAQLAAAPPTRMGYITANLMMLKYQVAWYVKTYKKPMATVDCIVRDEHTLHIMRMYLDDPKTTFPKNKVFGTGPVHKKIRIRLGLGGSEA
jgi:hypothetical protein